jgi:hypothetical protein
MFKTENTSLSTINLCGADYCNVAIKDDKDLLKCVQLRKELLKQADSLRDAHERTLADIRLVQRDISNYLDDI